MFQDGTGKEDSWHDCQVPCVTQALVIGAGLAGLTTAFELQRRGWDVTVIDGQPGVALGASHANGSLLTPSMAEPWNSPGVHRHLAKSLFWADSPLKLWPSAIPSLLGWGVRFLRHSTRSRCRAATEANFGLAHYSLRCLDELRSQIAHQDPSYGHGLIRIFRDPADMQAALAMIGHLGRLGLNAQTLDATGAVRLEPALEAIGEKIAGAVFFPDDQRGDAYQFCLALADAFTRAGGQLRLGAPVHGIDIEDGRVRGIRLSGERLSTSTVVLSAGVLSARLAAAAGVHLAIAPAKGYTVTLPVPEGVHAPQIPVADDAMHAGVVPVPGGLRLAGPAEFAGHDSRLEPQRISQLISVLDAIYPRIAASIDRSRASSWTGLRPVSADGVPLIGESRIRGLIVNSGHGPLGWTLAAGSARLLADLMCRTRPAIDATPYRVHR
jgi:D-amino-acid dehydrogenase